MNLNFDLNYPLTETAPPAAPLVPHTQQAAEGGGGAAVDAPIVIESSDDELQVLSPRGFQLVWNQPRRTNLSAVVAVDEEREIHTRTSDGPDGSVPDLSINRTIKRHPPNRTNISCESYSISEDDPIAKRTKPGKEVPVPLPPPPPLPEMLTFTCPICYETAVSPCSTICGHIFCEGCIRAALKVRRICPTCRTKLRMNQFHKVFLPTTTTERS